MKVSTPSFALKRLSAGETVRTKSFPVLTLHSRQNSVVNVFTSVSRS